jgi:hypothetical protein
MKLAIRLVSVLDNSICLEEEYNVTTEKERILFYNIVRGIVYGYMVTCNILIGKDDVYTSIEDLPEYSDLLNRYWSDVIKSLKEKGY